MSKEQMEFVLFDLTQQSRRQHQLSPDIFVGTATVTFKTRTMEEIDTVIQRLSKDPFFLNVDLKEEALHIFREKHMKELEETRKELDRVKRELEFTKRELAQVRGLPTR